MTQFLKPLLLLFLSASFSFATTPLAPVEITEQNPKSIKKLPNGSYLVDFGKVAFGNLELTPPAKADSPLTIHFGEAFEKGRINRKPPGTVRYNQAEVTLKGSAPIIVAPPADKKNTQQGTGPTPPAILTPPEWGVILPFRWVEIEGWPSDLKPEHIKRRAAFSTNWNHDASSFTCSDETLNRIWDLCKYSIKATTFAGVYVDGDRERIPYEADSYLNQLSHYTTSSDIEFARRTYDYLMNYATWPTEWASHMVFIAHADWMRTGDPEWLKPRYEALKSKLLMDRVGDDGLVHSDEKTRGAVRGYRGTRDIVDWPKTERDGYKFTGTNTVVNAFHIRSLEKMADIADAVGVSGDAIQYRELVKLKKATFQKRLFDTKRGIYTDGVGTDHASAHANFFPLAFGLIPVENRDSVIAFLRKKGMACSVYAAQYFLEGLFNNGAADKAMELITADGDRSWKHMVNTGTTITYEAWDQKYKPNQDWNHAWGAAPANLLPRYTLGVRPLVPGWKKALVSPNPGYLKYAKGKVPTPQGAVTIDWKNGDTFQISVTLPEGMPAKISLPASPESKEVLQNGKPVKAVRELSRWVLENEVTGSVKFEVR
ncbi:MAG: family 78 glycoside hydrolase catalytic domain [Akkermansiaceae bacterium]